MSNYFIGLFDLAQSLAPESLVAKLAANPPAVLDIIEKYEEKNKNAWPRRSWELTATPVKEDLWIVGPGGLSIRFKPGKVEIYNTLRFSSFTGDALYRRALRRACLFIADLFHSTRAIYTHELMPYGDGGLDQIEATLRARIGPPASSFEELHDADYFGPHAWYIDTFADRHELSL
jgi:hypothetical protein